MTDLQRAFPESHWSRILRATGSEPDPKALAELCSAYFHPIHAFFLTSLHCLPEEASDAVQSFFEALLAGKVVGTVEQSRGKFRNFLRTAARHHLYNCRKGSNPRVGAHWPGHVSVDAFEDHSGVLEDTRTPDRLFDAAWARVVVDTAFNRLKAEYAEHRHHRLAEQLLLDRDDEPSDAVLATELGTKPRTLQVRRTRLKDELEDRFERCLREEVGRTVSSPAKIEDELRYLLEALTSLT